MRTVGAVGIVGTVGTVRAGQSLHLFLLQRHCLCPRPSGDEKKQREYKARSPLAAGWTSIDQMINFDNLMFIIYYSLPRGSVFTGCPIHDKPHEPN